MRTKPKRAVIPSPRSRNWRCRVFGHKWQLVDVIKAEKWIAVGYCPRCLWARQIDWESSFFWGEYEGRLL